VTVPGLQLLIFAPIILAIIVLFPEGTVGMVKRRCRSTVLERFIH